jgi:hypothetical protein
MHPRIVAAHATDDSRPGPRAVMGHCTGWKWNASGATTGNATHTHTHGHGSSHSPLIGSARLGAACSLNFHATGHWRTHARLSSHAWNLDLGGLLLLMLRFSSSPLPKSQAACRIAMPAHACAADGVKVRRIILLATVTSAFDLVPSGEHWHDLAATGRARRRLASCNLQPAVVRATTESLSGFGEGRMC